jgi:perosamine synthetase
VNIPLSQPEIGEREVELVTRVLRSGDLSLGPRVAEFEEKFARFVGTRYAIAVNSGTSALHLCVKALGIGPEDEVLTTSFSFVASTNCLLYERALPVFADIHPVTLNMDPGAIRDILECDYVWDPVKSRHTNRWSGRTLKAILAVHIFGLPCEMGPILEIAREFNLPVLEDACEALGATYRGRPVGTFGDAAVFGFYPNKQMTTAEGGMIVTNDAQIAAFCRSIRNQGRDDQPGWLCHTRLGYNYRLSDLHCALGLAQLERIDKLLASRARVAAAYSRGLSGAPGITLPSQSPQSERSWFVYPIQLQGPSPGSARERLIEGLLAHGIPSRAYFPPIHSQPYFKQVALSRPRSLPRTDSAAEKCLALPFFSAMTDEQVTRVCDSVQELLAEISAGMNAGTRQFSAAAGSSE